MIQGFTEMLGREAELGRVVMEQPRHAAILFLMMVMGEAKLRSELGITPQLSDEEIAAHYENNKGNYLSEEQVAIEYITLNVDSLLSDISIDEKMIRQQYDKILKNFTRSTSREAAHIMIEGDDEAAQAKIAEVSEKLVAGEDFSELAKKYSEVGVKVIGLRYFNVFGKRQSKEYAGVIKLFLEKIKQKMPPKINGDGLQTRDFVHIDDVVRANISAMDSNIKHEFFNVGTENSISILDLANVVIDASGLSLEPIYGPELSGDVRSTRADITLIRKLLNWEPKIRLDDWLTKIISNKDFQDI